MRYDMNKEEAWRWFSNGNEYVNFSKTMLRNVFDYKWDYHAKQCPSNELSEICTGDMKDDIPYATTEKGVSPV
jgi:hypothetical protein